METTEFDVSAGDLNLCSLNNLTVIPTAGYLNWGQKSKLIRNWL